MADEKKKEPVKYKFGEQEFDLERYIKNIDANAASYMEKQNWNEGQKQEFMSAYNQLLGGLKDQLANNTNRFSTNSFGSILDSQGLLSNTDNDNIDPVGSEYYYDDKGNILSAVLSVMYSASFSTIIENITEIEFKECGTSSAISAPADADTYRNAPSLDEID